MKLAVSLSLPLILLVSTATAISLRSRLCIDISSLRVYRHGDQVPHLDPCTHCECDYGDIRCASAGCVPPTCADGATPVNQPGACCSYTCPPPTCLDPETGVRHPVGAIDNADDCRHCVCSASGRIFCAQPRCFAPDCGPNVIPVTKPGDCCPSCPEPPTCTDDAGNTHPVGKIETRDPCKFCECDASGDIMCMMASCAPLPCPDPVWSADRCCPTCPTGCSRDGTWYGPGPIPQEDPCGPTCHCDGASGHVTCSHVGCPAFMCRGEMYTPEGQCCPVCRE